MRLENVLALTHGKLINKPFVSSFKNIVFEAKYVKRGDLFIAFEEDDIDTAVFNGAYGIVFDKPTQISDSEIAWVKVQNNENALKRLLRFKLINRNITIYETNEITLKFALQIITEPNFIVLNGDIKNVFKTLLNVEEDCVILFSPSLNDKDIFTNTKTIPNRTILDLKIIEHTLFETSFIYDDIFYERELISPLFIPYLHKLLDLLKSLNINFRLKKFIPIEHFEAVFINKNLEIKEFGSSDRVLIFEKKISLMDKEIEFLNKYANWAKKIYITPNSYKTENDILEILKKDRFHFALIVGADKSILNKEIPKQKQLTWEF